MDGYGASTYGDRFADVYDDWYAEVTDPQATADAVDALVPAGPGVRRVVELGVGTGRLALPLAAKGLEVVGVDASEAMLARLRSKAGSEAIELHLADLGAMDELDLGPAAVILLAFNTLFNLTTEQAQLACLTRSASWLTDDGAVVIEAFVPADDLGAVGTRLEPTRMTADEVVLTVTRVDADGQTVFGQHVHLRESGIRLRPWQLRMVDPAALDALAARAGLELTERWASWDHDRFGPESDRHVSIYRRAQR